MELEIGFTLLFDDDGMKIEIQDSNSSIHFLKAHFDARQTCQIMSRLCSVRTKAEIRGLENVGKYYINRKFSFPFFPNCYPHKEIKEKASQIAKEYCPEGWEINTYFNSQDSFFEDEAYTTIYKYVDKEEHDRFNENVKTSSTININLKLLYSNDLKKSSRKNSKTLKPSYKSYTKLKDFFRECCYECEYLMPSGIVNIVGVDFQIEWSFAPGYLAILSYNDEKDKMYCFYRNEADNIFGEMIEDISRKDFMNIMLRMIMNRSNKKEK